ncbi:transmembrane protein, putative [Medicago truncatula]|uniref:Transmembrane protein, putative n=1 Tax=Medicago truncatula TaxID=3880 RepID=A0A072VHY5_MEDTR|nr:transmembrane protein, putative [Medicago truncatula]
MRLLWLFFLWVCSLSYNIFLMCILYAVSRVSTIVSPKWALIPISDTIPTSIFTSKSLFKRRMSRASKLLKLQNQTYTLLQSY